METHPIKLFLQGRGWTQAELARRLGIHEQTIYRIIAGTRWPSYKLAVRIRKTCGIPIEKLMGYNRP
ncbi:helix-turn-helix domain-containing protein [Candidatus Saccharibacteria bacterium]|nr:helix-turn-helix transcriptional regulator [Candidatus Saccharibacteria bacterium]NIV04485.1 helix-turn-helix domain-containing protein [Calditrichia bacterium]NIS38614.1 helix-turn-helix transcriptional regulator [Candidatus Saccharibacteria bacterium]NIV73079.1 helix-turn-helix domain-containing protein [Calditrichia bacterium]NIW00354.1 helix-turn-helix domain-containing protein [Candidatus Saccharibacteria bacterium]